MPTLSRVGMNIAGRIRRMLRRDKERVVLRLAKGATASTLPGSTYDLLQSYGYDIIAERLFEALSGP